MKAINILFQAIYDTAFMKVGNHMCVCVCVCVCVPKENETNLQTKTNVTFK